MFIHEVVVFCIVTVRTRDELVEHGPRVREILSSVSSQVKPMTYKIDSLIAWHLVLIG